MVSWLDEEIVRCLAEKGEARQTNGKGKGKNGNWLGIVRAAADCVDVLEKIKMVIFIITNSKHKSKL